MPGRWVGVLRISENLTHDDALLASLKQHPGYEILRRRYKVARRRYFRNLADKLARDNAPLDQRAIDEKRGMWMNGVWFFNEVEKGARAFERDITNRKEVNTSA